MKRLILLTYLLISFCHSGIAQFVPTADTISLGGIDHGRGWTDDEWTRRYYVATSYYSSRGYSAPSGKDSDWVSAPEEPVQIDYFQNKHIWWDSAGPKTANPVLVQSMVARQPFPYRVGVAIDTATYAAIKAKIKAADQLRLKARQAVDSLKSEIKATQDVLLKQKALTRHDSARAKSFSHQADSLLTTLETTQADLKTSDQALVNLYIALPPVLRYSLKETDPHTIGTAAVGYMKLQRKRKWHYAGGALLGGIVTGLILKR